MDWLDGLKGNPLPWLLEPENPSVRYGALGDLLGRPADDPQVRAAREAIPCSPPVAGLLAAAKQDGYWENRDYYLPKCTGTFWVLSALGDLGLDGKHEAIRRGCEFMFSHQREHGGFARRRRVPGHGLVWEDTDAPCTQARIVRFLLQFGYGEDPRARKGISRLLATQRGDGMWLCREARRRGCLRATHDFLRVAVLDPETALHPGTSRAAAAVCDLLMQPGMGRYHSSDMWRTLQYPYVDYSTVSTLDALARLGYAAGQSQVAAALEYLLGRQRADGSWPLDETVRRAAFDPGRPGEPNKWVTLDALRAIRLCQSCR